MREQELVLGRLGRHRKSEVARVKTVVTNSRVEDCTFVSFRGTNSFDAVSMGKHLGKAGSYFGLNVVMHERANTFHPEISHPDLDVGFSGSNLL